MDIGAEVEKRNLCRWRPRLEGGYHKPRNTKETTKTETGDGRPAQLVKHLGEPWEIISAKRKRVGVAFMDQHGPGS